MTIRCRIIPLVPYNVFYNDDTQTTVCNDEARQISFSGLIIIVLKKNLVWNLRYDHTQQRHNTFSKDG